MEFPVKKLKMEISGIEPEAFSLRTKRDTTTPYPRIRNVAKYRFTLVSTACGNSRCMYVTVFTDN